MFSLLKNLLITVVRASSKRGELANVIEKHYLLTGNQRYKKLIFLLSMYLQSPINVLAGFQLKNENANKEPTKGKRE